MAARRRARTGSVECFLVLAWCHGFGVEVEIEWERVDDDEEEVVVLSNGARRRVSFGDDD